MRKAFIHCVRELGKKKAGITISHRGLTWDGALCKPTKEIRFVLIIGFSRINQLC